MVSGAYSTSTYIIQNTINGNEVSTTGAVLSGLIGFACGLVSGLPIDESKQRVAISIMVEIGITLPEVVVEKVRQIISST